MNQNNDFNLIPSDYCLIYSCVIKYQSVILDNIKTKSIHCLNNLENHFNAQGETNLTKLYSSHLENFNCNCCAILNQNSKLNSKINFKFNSNQKFNQNSTKTASTSTINSKLKNTGRLSSATGHRMPNNFSKNANQQHNSTTSSNKINENVQSGVGVKQTPTNQPIRITDSSAIQLLAEDVESRLEALLRTFIQEEKLRQEARYNSLMGKRSASLSALNSEYSDVNQDLNTDYLSGSSVNRSIYNQQQLTNNKNAVINKTSNNNNFGFIKPQQHRMQQSYQLQNSQSVNTQPQQKTTTIKTSHRLDSSPSRSNVQNNLQNTKVTRTRSPSPTGRSTASQTTPNIMPVNRNNLFGQHTRTDQNKKASSTTTTNKPTTTNYLNLHQRSHSPSKDNQQPQLNKNQSSQLDKSYLQQFNQHSGPILHRLYSPNHHKMYDPFTTNSSQFGRSKDDSHIRRVVVYNLNKDVTSVEKKPVIIEQASISMNGTLNNNNASNTGEKIGTNLNDNQAIRLRSAKVRANSPNRVGMMNGNIGHNIQSANLIKQQQANASVTNRINSPANTITNLNSNNNKLSSSSNSNSLNSSNISSSSASSSSSNKKKLSTGSKVTTSATTNSRLSHENSSLKQFKDQNNNLDSNSQQQPQLNVGGSAAQLNVNNTERKVVRKMIVKELDGSNSNSSSSKRSESVLNNNTNTNNSNLNKLSSQSTTYQQDQRLSPILNGDLNNSVAKMATLNQQPTINSTSNLNNKSSLDILLSERDRILNNRDQYKLRNSNILSTSSSDVNNNYILSKNNKFNNSSIINDSSSTTNLLNNNNNNNNNSSAAGLLNFDNNQLTNRNLPLSSTNSVAKRKPLIDRYSPFSIVNEARQRWEEKNGMNGQLSTSRFNYLDDNNLKNSEHDNDLIFNEYLEQSDEEVVDSSMVLIRSRLSRILNTNGNVANLPNSTIISLLNHISNKNRNDENEISTSLPLPACLSELNNAATLNNPQLNTLNSTSSSTAINSMRPPVIKTNQTDCNQSNGQSSTSQNRANTVKPFLSKGSVAERVLLFEKHPQLKQIEEKEEANRKEESALTQKTNLFKSPVPYSSWREKNKNEVVNLSNSFEQNLKGRPPLSRQRSIQESLPLFYFPHGKPQNNSQQLDQLSKQVNQFFKSLKDGICLRENLVDLCKASNFPIYWKEPLFLMLAQNNQITHDSYLTFWRKLNGNYFDEASKFVFILTKGKRNFILPEDFIPMIQDVINSHPGLLFLKFAFEFHSRYVHTVIARIYYTVNRTWSGRISINELRKSNFLQIVKLLQDEDDINQITDYFSYEHFYVIYCKFWGLDKDHDLIIDKYDLSRHNDGAISSRMIDRIFSGAVTQSKSKSKQMTYQEFVFFLISEEDKKTETSIEYWFRCLDLDGDGYLKPEYELEYFYEEQVKRMESIGIEALPFTDLICQMLDMINPENPNKISLGDLKKCSMTYIFLDTFFNLHKYLLHEQKDPFSNKDDQTESDWNKFAAEEYGILIMEEQNQINENEKENQYNYNQQKYMSFVYDDKTNHENNLLKKEYDDYYDTTDQEDYDYLYTDDESLY